MVYVERFGKFIFVFSLERLWYYRNGFQCCECGCVYVLSQQGSIFSYNQTGASQLFFCLTERYYVLIFFIRLWSLRKTMFSRSMGRLVIFLLAVWFSIYTHVQLRILKFQDSQSHSLSKCSGLRTDHKRVKKIETLCCSVTQVTQLSESGPNLYTLS